MLHYISGLHRYDIRSTSSGNFHLSCEINVGKGATINGRLSATVLITILKVIVAVLISKTGKNTVQLRKKETGSAGGQTFRIN